MIAGDSSGVGLGIRAASIVLLFFSATIAGCNGAGTAGSLRVRSLGDEPVLLDTDFTSAVFSHDADAETSFWLSDVTVDDLLAGRVSEGQIVHVELLWRPRAGSTPMDPSATNASIRYVVLSHGEVGLYVGAGYATTNGSLDGSEVSVVLRDASLKLSESTGGFVDLLGPAQVSGRFDARRDPEEARRIFVSVSQHVTDALGKTQFVRARGDDDRVAGDFQDLMPVILTRR